MRKFEKIDLDLSYLKAKAAFKKCVKDEENEFLIDEIDVPIDSLILSEESVKVSFLKREIKEYVIETKIHILSKNKQMIGIYTLYEDNDGVFIDDSLIIN